MKIAVLGQSAVVLEKVGTRSIVVKEGLHKKDRSGEVVGVQSMQ